MGSFTVAITALDKDVETFAAHSTSAENLSSAAAMWPQLLPYWGLWTDAQGAFNEACGEVESKVGEGATALGDISTTLGKVAKIYRTEEENGTHASTQMF
ncbi:MAG: hypothetical protein ACTH2Q_05845 [Propionibacteriaceae bacterium]